MENSSSVDYLYSKESLEESDLWSFARQIASGMVSVWAQSDKLITLILLLYLNNIKYYSI